MRRIDLRYAFEWTCDECGRDNYARAVPVSLSPEEMDALSSIEGDDVREDELFTSPDTVTCIHCKVTFQARMPSEGS